jgi:hypothetical protein
VSAKEWNARVERTGRAGPDVQRELRDLFADTVADLVITCGGGLDEAGVRSGEWRHGVRGHDAVRNSS